MIFKASAVLAFLATVIWAFVKPGWDSICAALAALAAVIGAFAQKNESAQSQTVATGGIGIQAGRDVSTGNISTRE